MAGIADGIQEKVKLLPRSPGVYKFLDDTATIIYVGKAKDLRKRVSSYFQPGRARDARLERLVSEVRDIHHIQTLSESEALIYEAGLIKDHSPRFNIELKDDRSYPFLKLTVNERYPRVFLTRKRLNDGAVYYGPYVNVFLLKEALSFMKKVFPLRTCVKLRKKVCLEYHIGQCHGPCEGRTTAEEYIKIVEQLRAFLEGRKDDLLRALKEEMVKASASKEYEKALTMKTRIEAFTAIRNYRKGASFPIFGELDELKHVTGMEKTPEIIECFDISNISGTKAVGSMVRFVSGKPDKPGYRKFRIRTVDGVDDYSMMREVVTRRYSRLISENGELPDLVLIDGGKGHLAAVRGVLDGLGLEGVPAAGIAKEYNHLYVDKKDHPLRLSPGSRLLFLIQRIRDEAHRVAVQYHRKLRSKEAFL